jgi:hypothetical protein
MGDHALQVWPNDDTETSAAALSDKGVNRRSRLSPLYQIAGIVLTLIVFGTLWLIVTRVLPA